MRWAGVAVLAIAASAATASSAAAATVPFSLDLNHGYANIGSAFSDSHVLNGRDPAHLTGTMDSTTGDFTVPPAGFSFPTAHFEAVGGVNLEMSAVSPVEGNYNAGTGALSGDVDLKATVELLNESPIFFGTRCEISPIPFSFSTAGTDPHEGFPFSAGLAGRGAIAGAWADVPDSVSTGEPTGLCAGLIDALAEGPGGIWLGHDGLPVDDVRFEPILDDGKLDLGGMGRTDIIDAFNPARIPDGSLEGRITGDGASGADFTLPTSGGDEIFTFPLDTGMVIGGSPVTLQLVQNAPITGHTDVVSGVTSTTADMTLQFNVGSPLTDVCEITPPPLTLTSGETDPIAGDPFDGLFLDGAMSVKWASLPSAVAVMGSCGAVNAAAAGPGGLWFANGVVGDPVDPPPVGPPTTPPSGTGGTAGQTAKTCKKGQKKVKVKGKTKCVKKPKKKKK